MSTQSISVSSLLPVQKKSAPRPVENCNRPLSYPLLETPLFKNTFQHSSLAVRTEVTYQRARAIARVYNLTVQDVLFLKPKFWDLHRDMICSRETGALTLLAIQYNLTAGTLAPFALKRPELRPLLDSIMKFEVSGQFLLSEVGHGLDAPRLETTATLLPNGEFDLNTPNPGAAKHMPPTGPTAGIPKVAMVIARLVVGGEDRGLRPFVVPLGNGIEMCEGITAKLLPRRIGSKPVDHAITTFNHVRLPGTALLGSLEKPKDMRQNFLSVIWRVGVGSLVLSTYVIGSLKSAAYICGKYSARRTVGAPTGGTVPILSFRTQQKPILHALAQTVILDAYANDATLWYMNPSFDPRVKHGFATCFKAVLTQATQTGLYNLAERCGAQGLFEHNQMAQMQLEARGNSIAEGDTLALCIRLASELLIGRYQMPPSRNPKSLIARHELGLFEECGRTIASIKGGHRSDEFNRMIIPRCQTLVEAIGHRLAYDAAVDAKVDPAVLALYEAGLVLHDSSWYAENAGLTRDMQFGMEDKALNDLLPRMDELLEETGAGPYVTAPIVTADSWSTFVKDLPEIGGKADGRIVSRL